MTHILLKSLSFASNEPEGEIEDYQSVLWSPLITATFAVKPILNALAPRLIGDSTLRYSLPHSLSAKRNAAGRKIHDGAMSSWRGGLRFEAHRKVLAIIMENAPTAVYAPAIAIEDSFDDYRFIAKTPLIRSLSIASCMKMSKEIAKNLQNCRLLEHFSDSYDSSDDKEYEALFKALADIPGKPLKYIDIYSVHGVFEKSPFTNFGTKFPKLVSFLCTDQFEADTILSICECPLLSCLHFGSEHTPITRKHLKAINDNLPYLSDLQLAGDVAIRGADVEVLTDLPYLRVFALLEEKGRMTRNRISEPFTQHDFDTLCRTLGQCSPNLEELHLTNVILSLRNANNNNNNNNNNNGENDSNSSCTIISFDSLCCLKSLKELTLSINDSVSFVNGELESRCFDDATFCLPKLEILRLPAVLWRNSRNETPQRPFVVDAEKGFSTFGRRFPRLNQFECGACFSSLSDQNLKNLLHLAAPYRDENESMYLQLQVDRFEMILENEKLNKIPFVEEDALHGKSSSDDDDDDDEDEDEEDGKQKQNTKPREIAVEKLHCFSSFSEGKRLDPLSKVEKVFFPSATK